VDLSDGYVNYIDKTFTNYVWAVRGVHFFFDALILWALWGVQGGLPLLDFFLGYSHSFYVDKT
jgi:hypothetical protein